MPRLEREDIVWGLRELVARARAAGIVGARIYIVGGAALRLAYFDRPATGDIDARIHLAAELQPIIDEIANQRGWMRGWLNSAAEKFIPGYGSPVEWVPVLDDQSVSVWIAPADTLLAMKLKAMEGRRGRDEDDVAYLLAINGIASAEEAEELLGSFFPGDALNDRAYATLIRIIDDGLPPPVPPMDVDLGG
ncbi:hypothetical protein [Protaetiibacter intestinalis]|uniref:Nucleotidyl transferase n=1 Tax=Protaetiibacter intestinalis TaxID=2419774 RepID=A0A387B4N6_9MICO|nr:hypothetical protein [Protaetiibacter intestinalis]AYF97383.1 hypothetical protein D7I47_03365 [Protaetiibacter intestinalis]